MSAAGPSDSWDEPSVGSDWRVPGTLTREDPVPDDWDDDEEEEEESPQKLWQDANNKAPMPQLIIAPTATASSATQPPPAALQPSIRILKRPSNTPPGPSAASSADSQQQKSLAEREAQYQAARERIFGASETPAGGADSDVNPPVVASGRGSPAAPPARNTTPLASKVIRAPRGPEAPSDSGSSAVAKGFRDRKRQVQGPTSAR